MMTDIELEQTKIESKAEIKSADIAQTPTENPKEKFIHISKVKDGEYTGDQLEFLKRDNWYVVLNSHKTHMNSVVKFEVGRVQNPYFLVDDDKNCHHGFKIHEKYHTHRVLRFGEKKNEYIASVNIPDDACVVIKTLSRDEKQKQIIVNCVDVKEITLIADMDFWADESYLEKALKADINNLCYLKSKNDDDSCLKLLHEYFGLNAFGLSTELLDIIIRTCFPIEKHVCNLTENEIYYLLFNVKTPKQRTWALGLLAHHIPLKTKRELLEKYNGLHKLCEDICFEYFPSKTLSVFEAYYEQ